MAKIIAKFVAATAAAGLVATPVLAEKANTLTDLVGIRASSGQSALDQRGFSYAEGKTEANTQISYYWHARDKNCIRVETYDGRYTAITDASNKDCGKGGGSDVGVAAAAIGAVALGALLLSRKDKKKDESGYQQDWQQVEAHGLQSGTLRIFAQPDKNSRVRGQVDEGSLLRNYGCDNYNGESWCEVTTMNGRTKGWARDRYLRASDTSASHLPDYGGTGGELVEVYGLSSGQLKIVGTPSKNGYVVGRVSGGTTLRRTGCKSSEGENWCHVATLDGYLSGWARDRYLRTTSSGGGNRGSIAGIEGMYAVNAIDELRSRGFDNVDSQSSGNTIYGIYYYRPTRLCVQTTAANGRIVDIRDIQRHPRCR